MIRTVVKNLDDGSEKKYIRAGAAMNYFCKLKNADLIEREYEFKNGKLVINAAMVALQIRDGKLVTEF